MQIKDTKLNWSLNVVARVFVGLVFLFSSFVKGVDPMGTAFKINDYLTAWQFGGLSLEWLQPAAPFLSMLLITLEFLVGMLLLAGSFRRGTAWLLALMMIFFTITTLYDAITNKVSDCGCFGDAIKLTNWQTFWKNIILDIPTLWIFLTRCLRLKRRTERDTLVAIFAIMMMVIFGLFNINNEPCIDFRAWKVGNQMVEMDENLQVKSYLTYRNKSTGETQEFPSEELMKKMEDPAWEEAWEWESSRVEDPHEIKADGFAMMDMEMNDHAQELIASQDYLMMVTLYDLNKIDEKVLILSRNSYDIKRLEDDELKVFDDKIIYNDKEYDYKTIHKSKGLEEENVIILNLENSIYGFPNKRKDITEIILEKEKYKFEEERRLFYVALTRSKNNVYLFCSFNNPSIFVKEIIRKSKKYIEVLDL